MMGGSRWQRRACAEAAVHLDGAWIGPDDAAPRVAPGRDAEAANTYEGAIQRGAQIGPHSGVSAHVGLAGAMVRMGQPEKVLARYREVADLDDGSAEAHLGLADALSKTGRATEAQKAYERAVELDPGMERGHYGKFGGWGV